MLDAELEWLVEPELVLDVRQPVHNTHKGGEVLIKLKGLPSFEASWESVDLIAKLGKQFPNFHLEDKVSSEPGVVVDH